MNITIVMKMVFLYPSQKDIGKTKLKYNKIKLILATIVVSRNSNKLTPLFIPIVKQPTVTLIKRIIIATIYFAYTICFLNIGKLFTITSLSFLLSASNVFTVAPIVIITDIIMNRFSVSVKAI
ncbi:Uncharacterised protein [Streptococcus pneumoniae]|nr:Uncharacterised protein [Streptococcus pneumoniae]